MWDNEYTEADMATDILNSTPEVAGFCLSLLGKKYAYAALYAYTNDDSVRSWLYRRLVCYAHARAKIKSWPRHVRRKIDALVMLALQELRGARGITVAIKLTVLGVSERTFYRSYSKAYNDIYSTVLDWAHLGAASALNKLE